MDLTYYGSYLIFARFLWIVGLVLKKQIIDLEWLILAPKASPNSSKILLNVYASLIVGITWSKVPSMNYWCVEVGKFSKGLRHFISPTAVALFILILIPSIIIMNRKVDRGSPFLMPLDGQKCLVGAPFINIEKTFVETRVMIQLIQCWSKPKASNILAMQCQLILL